jgi:hypothetical protein
MGTCNLRNGTEQDFLFNKLIHIASLNLLTECSHTLTPCEPALYVYATYYCCIIYCVSYFDSDLFHKLNRTAITSSDMLNPMDTSTPGNWREAVRRWIGLIDKQTKILFRSVPLITVTPMGTCNLRNGTRFFI